MCITCIKKMHSFENINDKKDHDGEACGCGGRWNAVTRTFDSCQNNQICSDCYHTCSDEHELLGWVTKEDPFESITQCRFCEAQSSSSGLYYDEVEKPDEPDLKKKPFQECTINRQICSCCLEKRPERLREACLGNKCSSSSRFCLDCLRTCVYRMYSKSGKISKKEICRLCMMAKENNQDWLICKKKS